MDNQLFNIPNILLMGPGPSCVSETVYKALAKPTLGHLDPSFIDIMDDIKEFLKKLMGTENQLTVPISGTGSAGMETCFVNLIEPEDKVLILINGVFGMRMEDVANRLGAEVDCLKFEWGNVVDLELVRKKLLEMRYDLVAVVHAETSTGVCNPVDEIGRLVKENGALYLVDCVTSMGGIQLKMDEWNIDALYSGTQKCLSCPPGLSPVSFSEKALHKLINRKSKVPNWYLDLSMITKYWSGNSRVYHHTAPINMLYGLYQACFNIIDEGMENVVKRHMEMHLELIKELNKLNLQLFVQKEFRLPMLNSIIIPEGVDDAKVRSSLINDYKIEIGGGLGPLAGKIWRIGLMGETAKKESIHKLMDAFRNILN
jgi:alanine-glyoxylate transaminase/serine-glyoxylate transaminase/serine-pyruvate transaminase